MRKFLTQGNVAALIIVAVLIIDQWIKIVVKTSMSLHESIHIADWFYIYFTENPGMAFGMEIIEKSLLTLFRIFVVAFIGWYIFKLVHRKENPVKMGYIVCLSLIFSGAMGNIIDSVFYGEIFNESTPFNISHFVPWGTGYASWLHGKVVDMFYFPIIDTYWPEWMPLVGGEHFIFFSPIFNFADSAISCGIIALLIFYRNYLGNTSESASQNDRKS